MMQRLLRRVLATLACTAILLLLAAGAGWWFIHTSGFASLFRLRILSTLRSATGGRVEMGRFIFNPDTLEATVNGLKIHGTEPKAAPPLLSVDSISISLKILSVWRRSIDLQTLTVQRPQLFILVNPDGVTNIPAPRRKSTKTPVEQLLDLAVKHLEITGGLLQLNNRKLPFDLLSNDLGLTLDYNFAGPSYAVHLATELAKMQSGDVKFPAAKLNGEFTLFRDYADIKQLQIATLNSSSTVALSGKVQHFRNPTATAKVQAHLSVDDLAQLASINQQLQHGQAEAQGEANYDSASAYFTFNGKAQAQGVDFVSAPFTLRGMKGTSDLFADNNGMLLKNSQAEARGAHFTGEGSIKAYNLLQVSGRVSQVELHEVGTYLTKAPFPWSGVAHGTAHASAHLQEKDPDFIIGANVEIQPGRGSIPTSGNIEVNYSLSRQTVEFGDSALQLPHSRATFNGSLNKDLMLKVESSNLDDLQSLAPVLGVALTTAQTPTLNPGGEAHFDGSLHNVLYKPSITGEVAIGSFKFDGFNWDRLNAQIGYSAENLSIPQFQLQQAGARLTGNGFAQLQKWSLSATDSIQLNARFTNLDVVKTVALFTTGPLPVIPGRASGDAQFGGTWADPHGTASVRVSNLDAYGEQLNQIQFTATLSGNQLQLNKGQVHSGPAILDFSLVYQHLPSDWYEGNVSLKADTNGFPLSSSATVRKYIPGLNARAEIHLDGQGKWRSQGFVPAKIDGRAQFTQVSVDGRELGDTSLNAVTKGKSIDFKYTGNLRDAKFHGAAQAQLTSGTPITGDVQMERIGFATLRSLLPETKLDLPIDGFLDGRLTFKGLLESPADISAQAVVNNLEITSAPTKTQASNITLRNKQPILVDIFGGDLRISRFEIEGKDTSVSVTGSAPLSGNKPLDIKAVGTADLGLFSMFDSNVRSSGSSELQAALSGQLTNPNVSGVLKVRNGSFFLPDISNGLSEVNGTVNFTRNRAVIQTMTAHSGGGDISLNGSLSFAAGSPLVYQLVAEARNVRVRYANSISVTSNADLRLSGTSLSSLLSGTLTVNRVVFTPNADAGNLLAAASSGGAANPDQGDFISGLHLDINVESAPNLQVSTNLSRDVEAEVQLHLRGTPDHPIVLGNIDANQGDIKIFGTRFTLNRGEVSFVNTVRVEPVLDLDLETETRGVTVDITVSGTPSKLNFNYRSDPPLQPRDIIALLTVGRAPDVGATSNAQGASDVSALSSGVNSVLGQAISPVSNRLSKLFGIANIRIDPFVQGITNTPQARLSVEQQISRNVTVTYVTNLSQTSEQIFRFEWALSRQFSVVAIRDDNGEFGIDFQYKKRFK